MKSNRAGKNNGFYKHGMFGSKIYQTWNWMIQRCHNKNTAGFKRYGARGITVCKKWRKFQGFFEDMGDRPKGKTLERIDNDKGYFKENCRWATPKEQARNRRTSRLIDHNGQRKTLAEWCEIYKTDGRLIHARLKRGWSLDEAFTIEPVIGRNQTFRNNGHPNQSI